MNRKTKKIILIIALILVVISISIFISRIVASRELEKVSNEKENQNKNLQEQYLELKNEKEKLSKTVKNLEEEIERLKKDVENNNLNNIQPQQKKDQIRPTILAVIGPQKNLNVWEFQFDEEINSDTLRIGNINVYSVVNDQRNLNNKVVKSLKYNQGDYSLKIIVETKYLKCDGCKWELHFTTKIKDLAGNSLVDKIFTF